MHVEHRSWTRLGRLVMLAGIGFAGLLSIVGSGGGSLGFPPCEPPLCEVEAEASPILWWSASSLPTLPRWSARQ